MSISLPDLRVGAILLAVNSVCTHNITPVFMFNEHGCRILLYANYLLVLRVRLAMRRCLVL